MNVANNRKLIAVDCDGTLFDSNTYPSTKTCEVVQRLVDSGHQIMAVTGRSRHSACERLVQVPGLRYLVCSNGACAWDTQKAQLVWQSEISIDRVVHIVSKLRGAFADVAFAWESAQGIGFEKTFVELAGGIGELETGGHAGDLGTQGIFKLKVRRPAVHTMKLLDDVLTILGVGCCEITVSGAPFIEITAPGTDKAFGLEKTATGLAFSAADTIVFGDQHNDLPMFQWAGHRVAMGNAVEAVKAVAHATTRENTEHGVAHYLEGLLDAGKI